MRFLYKDTMLPDEGTVVLKRLSGAPWEKEVSYTHIGTGGFGKVYRLKTTPRLVMKVFEVESEFRKEKTILSEIHRRLKYIRGYEKHICLNKPNYEATFYDKPLYALFYPSFQMNLKECWYSPNYAILTLTHVEQILGAIREGLHLLHSNRIIHRDIKPENIYLSFSDERIERVVIGDFGLTSFHDEVEIKGSLLYMSPWVFSAHKKDLHRNDWWSYACLVLNFLTLHKAIVLDEEGNLSIEKDFLHLYIHPSLKGGPEVAYNAVFIQTAMAVGKIPNHLCQAALMMKSGEPQLVKRLATLTTNFITDRYESDDEENPTPECISVSECINHPESVVKSVVEWKFIRNNDEKTMESVNRLLSEVYKIIMSFSDKPECSQSGGSMVGPTKDAIAQMVVAAKASLRDTQRLAEKYREPVPPEMVGRGPRGKK